MKRRSTLACSVTVAVAVLGAAGCGKLEDKIFQNYNPPVSQRSTGTETETSPPVKPRKTDQEVPNYWDNNRHKWPQDMSSEDEAVAQQIASGVKARLEALREQGRISPDEVRPVLEQAAGGRRVVAGNLVVGAANRKTDGTAYGIWVGKTGCVTGAVNREKVWAHANGRYIEHGCLTPPVGH
ncbi:hypothetical protein LKL35_32510 [Streptomyces sp. ET3-23]|uniref:hypothetical protein n=1 Tax=Streptomyces sp. ET3-23 TaxID=2885643 RepID=UPI001D11CF94|nr:hypothetical protein [Streptomyces sp. ET3-23]MCC2280112.1 hypothetical protein [Streptomyces sp. ET3-23]